MSEILKSPINYTGSKYRLLKKGLLNYFPKDINLFVDLFGGSGNVSINIDANRIVYNDIIFYIPELYNKWKNDTFENVKDYIDNRIKEFNLSSENEEGFKNFRKEYNKTKNIYDLFILVCYSFNYQIRFNNNQEYNSSFGKTASTMNNNIIKNLKIFIKTIKDKDIQFISKDFRELKLDKLTEKDFIYLDPPYLISCGVYQDGKRGFNGWDKKDELDLYNLCNKLNERNIKFALSNLIYSKGNENEILKKWVEKNNYNINYLDHNYNNSNYQRKNDINKKDVEVLITNYNI